MDKLEEYIDILNEYKDSIDMINDLKTFETLKLCDSFVYSKEQKMNFVNLVLRKNFHQTLAKLFCYIESIKSTLNFDECRGISKIWNDRESLNLTEKCVLILIHLDRMFNKFFLLSIEIRRFFAKINPANNKTYLSSFISFIDDINFINNLIKCYPRFDGFINSIQNLSTNADECKSVWQELNSVNVLLKFAANNQKFSIETYAIIAYVASDEDLEKMTIISDIITKFTNLVVKCVSDTNKERYDQEFKDVDDQENKLFSVSCISLGNGFGLSIDVLLLSLYYFAINEKLKLDIYNKENIKESLKKIIYTGIDVEKYFSIQLLSQLSFNSQVRDEIKANTNLIDYIESLQTQELKFKKLKKSCENILWIIRQENTKNEVDTKHIMISYNSASRPTCLKIKTELEKQNFKVWIDVDEIHGSSLDSMAKAVEQAQCVLMCVTEKYRQSVNCKSEAEYASRLGKNIIPVIMEKGYDKVTGWLGIIMGAKIFVDFCKHDFESAIKLLIKQIKLLNGDKIETTSSSTKNEPIKSVVSHDSGPIFNDVKKNDDKEPKNWDVKKAKEYIESKNLDKIYLVLSDQIDGSILHQLYEMKLYTPEFYYKSLTKNDILDMKMVFDLTKLLCNLFDNKDK